MPSVVRIKLIDVNEDPLVSVVMPMYNSEKYLETAINSVQSQTYSNWELILIDDGSTDKSAQIALKIFPADSRITYKRLPANQGTAFCRNKATQMAKGDYIAFLDSDDIWAPDKLEMQVQFMQKNDCDVSFSNYLHIDEDDKFLGKRILAMPSLSYKKQLRNNYVGNLTGMYNAKKIGKITSPNLKKRQDWALWLQAIKRSGKPALGIQCDLAYYRIRKGSLSTNKLRLLKHNFQFYRDYLEQSWPVASYSLIRFLWEYFFVRPKFIEKSN